MKKNKAIVFRKVSKKYRKGRKLLLKEALLDIFKPGATEDFWALKDVSFEVNKGETLGIIGPNGSGKSTILKLIAEVTTPTKGNIEVCGRVAPLIELGAGFHPELSGRENIHLNGVILGLSKKEIEKKFDKIVEFSELGDFIDTPVKHYSSGMYLRLGFSVAVHTAPEILLIDEILAVGDESFSKKSIKKMEEFKSNGVTIVFVSHALEKVKSFCTRVIYLGKTKVQMDGDPDTVINFYKNKNEKK